MPKRLTNNVVDITTGRTTEESKNTRDIKASTKREPHKWDFKPRFRRGAFGWKSQPAISRIKEALAEIKKVSRRDAALAGEGAVLFLERVSPAIEKVDSSSGAIGSAVNRAVRELVPIISTAPVDNATREAWLERLFKAHEADNMPYIEILSDYWGELCCTPEMASKWADELIALVRLSWSDAKSSGHYHGTSACLSALLKAGRNEELLGLLELDRHKLWHYQQFGARALANMGKVSEAIDFAERCCSNLHGDYMSVARSCEEILLNAGRSEEAYLKYAIEANRENSFLSTYRSIAKKYPHKAPEQLLRDLIDAYPGEEGKWFATAKELGLLELALELARMGPCDPKTLTRAAEGYMETSPAFAADVGMCALVWLFKGYGYDITSADVWAAYRATIKAADACGHKEDALGRIREAVAFGLKEHNWVAGILASEFR